MGCLYTGSLVYHQASRQVVQHMWPKGVVFSFLFLSWMYVEVTFITEPIVCPLNRSNIECNMISVVFHGWLDDDVFA